MTLKSIHIIVLPLLFLGISLNRGSVPSTETLFQEINRVQSDIKRVRTEVKVSVYLEGPLDLETGKMRTRLNKLGYLPGQKPMAFFGKSTPAGQPFNKGPWNYDGPEGRDAEKSKFLYPVSCVDWILLSIRSDMNANSTVYRTAALLLEDGVIYLPFKKNQAKLDPKNSYYIVIEHRNHLAVMSHIPVSIINGELKYDFRNQGAYGAAISVQKEMTKGTYAMYAGNGDQSIKETSLCAIDDNDLSLWQKQNGKNSQYLSMDLDMSGDVSIRDQELLFTNYGVISDVPCRGF